MFNRMFLRITGLEQSPQHSITSSTCVFCNRNDGKKRITFPCTPFSMTPSSSACSDSGRTGTFNSSPSSKPCPRASTASGRIPLQLLQPAQQISAGLRHLLPANLHLRRHAKTQAPACKPSDFHPACCHASPRQTSRTASHSPAARSAESLHPAACPGSAHPASRRCAHNANHVARPSQPALNLIENQQRMCFASASFRASARNACSSTCTPPSPSSGSIKIAAVCVDTAARNCSTSLRSTNRTCGSTRPKVHPVLLLPRHRQRPITCARDTTPAAPQSPASSCE